MPTIAAPPGKTLPPELQQLLSKVTDIGSLPEITTRIVDLVQDQQATAHDMHAIIQRDPALAARILRVVNSAFYGLPSQVSSLDRAILLLGLSAIKNIALGASLARMFNVQALSDQFTARDLWRHSISVAVAARELAVRTKCVQPDEAFVAGLVHDIGLLAVQQLLPTQLRAVVQQASAAPVAFCVLEQVAVGADHQAFGNALASKWRFPANLRHTIAYHHEPLNLQPEFRRLAALIYAADTLCGTRRLGFWLTAQTQEVTDQLLALVRVTRAELDTLGNELEQRVADAEQVFG
jgi:HD-like signal output (HDOD) protein